MNFWKDPQYSSIRVLIIVVLVIAGGFFAYKYENTSKKLTGQVINTSSSTAGIPSVTTPGIQTVMAQDNYAPGATISNGVNFTGDLTSLGGASNASVGIEYGPTAAYGNSSPASWDPPFILNYTSTYTVFVASASVPCNTTVHYRATANNIAGTVYGVDKTFKTASCTAKVNIGAADVTSATAIGKTTETTTPPTVTTYGSSSVTSNSAYLTGKLTSFGSATSAMVGFNYGTTSALGSTVFLPSAMTVTGAFNRTVTGLAACTTYYFQATATSSAGAANGAPMTFTTTGCGSSLPIVLIDDVVPGSITKTSAMLKGTLTSLGGASSVNVGFESLMPSYSLTSYVPVPAATPSVRTTVGDFTTPATGLTCGTTYYTAAHAIIPGTPSTTVYSVGDGHFTTSPC